MLQKINFLAYAFGLISYLSPFIVLLKRREFRSPLFLYSLINLLAVILSLLFLIYFSNSFPVFHFAIFLSTSVLFFYFYRLDKEFPVFYGLSFLVLLLSFVIEIIFVKGLWQNNILTTLVSNFSLTIISLRQLYIILKEEVIREISHLESIFYISISILVFNSSSFFFSILETQIRSEINELFLFTFPLFMFFTVLFNVLFSVGLWKRSNS